MERSTLALKLFKLQDAHHDVTNCLVELGTQYYFNGYVKEAKLLMEQILDDVDPKSSTYVITMGFLTFLSSVLGEFDTSARYYKESIEIFCDFPEFERKAATALINISQIHASPLYITSYV